MPADRAHPLWRTDDPGICRGGALLSSAMAVYSSASAQLHLSFLGIEASDKQSMTGTGPTGR